ncbi:DNA translocase FtsK 4TM domain-containing protein, partial [Alteromonas stellipolaris]|uniref:DNA translocase FtsK 4TM domain-containing protein n=1 Tax=Alteromonas stellipolaris TaxID=233316 RepID=UPI0035694ECF
MTQLTGIQRIWEAGMIIACVFAFFLLLALVSFHPGDPGWSQAGLQLDVHNWVGSTGAWSADLLLFSFGFLAYLLPFGAAFLGWFLFQHIKALEEFDYLTIGLRIIGGLLMALGATGIASINFDDIYNFSAGGFVGDVISSALVPYFNTAGTILLLLCFFCTGFTLLTGISWLSIVDRLGEMTLWFGRKCVSIPQQALALDMPRLALPSRSAKPENDELDITSMRAEPAETPEPVFTPPPKAERSEPSFGIPDDVFDEDDVPPFETQSHTPSKTESENKPKSSFSLSGMREAVRNKVKEAKPSSKDEVVENHQIAKSQSDEMIEPTFDMSQTDTLTEAPATEAQQTAEPVNIETPEPQSAPAPESAPAPKPAHQPFTPVAMGAKSITRHEGEGSEPITAMPSFDLLERADKHENPLTQEEIDGISRLVEEKLADFNIEANVVGVYPGPVITRFELDLAP